MPLHAITATYGEPGLRERFAAEIAGFGDVERRRLADALELASRLHSGDRRQNEPYINHPLRVALRIMSHYGIRDPDVIVAALLHDVVEDHAAELAPDGQTESAQTEAAQTEAAQTEAALSVLAERFGPRVAELVAAVTNPEWDPGRDRHVQYREHVAASLDRSPWARVIKASDFTDNGAGLLYTTGPRVPELADKYAQLVPVLRELINRPDTPLDRRARQRVLEQLDRAEERFAAILPPSGSGCG
jgi:predicted HD phosphohydrolase